MHVLFAKAALPALTVPAALGTHQPCPTAAIVSERLKFVAVKFVMQLSVQPRLPRISTDILEPSFLFKSI